MKLRCLTCEQEINVSEEDIRSVVQTVDKHNLGTTAILDMLTPLAGYCDQEAEDYHVLDFDQEETDELHRLGEAHKTATNDLNIYVDAQKITTGQIKELRSKLTELIKTNDRQLTEIYKSNINIKHILSRCKDISYSKRIELWQTEEEPKESNVETK